MVDLGVIVGAAVFSVIPIVMLFLVLRSRGDLIRLWCSNVVPYFKRMRWNRPLRLKVRRDIGQTLNDDVVKLIDEAIFKQGSTDEKKSSDVPQALFDSWKVIRKEPKRYTIWGTFFKRAWRLPDGLKGRWIFMYHLFPLEEMTKRYGRHQLIQGILSPQPLSVHAPPSKEQWVQLRLKDDSAKGIIPDKKRINAYVKQWRKLSKEKWLNVLFYPTVTVTQEAQLYERLQGFGNLVTICAYLLRVSGEKLAKYDFLAGYAEHSQGFMDKAGAELHDLADDLGTKDITLRELNRAIKELRTPINITPEHAPMPFKPYTPQPAEKPSKLKAQLPDNWAVYLCVFLGFASLMWGLFTSGVAQMVVGAFLIGLGAFMLWREGKKVKLPEAVREAVTEQKESAMEQGA